jgi:hypothetical protein
VPNQVQSLVKKHRQIEVITSDNDEPALVAKPHAKPSPKPKSGLKRKWVEIEGDSGEPTSSRKLRKRA